MTVGEYLGYNKMMIIEYLIRWYLWEFPVMWWRGVRNLGNLLVELFGISAHLKYFGKPMFHDSTIVGYALTYVFRLLIVLSGSFVWMVLMLSGSLVLPLWFGVHLFWLINWEIALVGELLIIMVTFLRLKSDIRWEKVGGQYALDKFRSVCLQNERNLIDKFPDLRTWWSNQEVSWWLARMGLWGEVLPEVSGVAIDVWAKKTWDLAIDRKGKINIGVMLVALMMVDDQWQSVLRKLDLSLDQLVKVLDWEEKEKQWWSNPSIWDENYVVGEMAGFNRAMTGVRTPTLDKYSIDLTLEAGKLPLPVAREEKYNELFAVLSRSRGENVMVLGENGVGKSTFVSGIARMIMDGSAPLMIRNKRVVKLEPGRLLAGTMMQTDAAGRLVKLLDDIKASEDIILFLDEIHTMMTLEGMESGINLLSIIQEAVGNSKIQLLGATNLKNYKKFIEPNEAFTRMFSVVNLEEPSDVESILILENVVHDLERDHGVLYSYPALQQAVVLSRRYIQESVLPDKAKNVLDMAGARAKQSGLSVVNVKQVAEVITAQSGIPVHKVNVDEKQKLLNLEDEIHGAFVGQDLAVKVVADSLRRARLDIRSDRRPIGSFLFVGPTGVGKTELSKQLAKVYFGSEQSMVRFDMAEFSQLTMVNRLVGAPVGTSGYGVGGELTERVRRHPFSLILLDELEKAHPKVWDLLLQVLDDGRLTDASGMTVDFTHTIIIATSNAVTAYIQNRLLMGDKLDDMKQDMVGELSKTFRLEFINRFDGIVPFAPLSQQEMVQVVELEMRKLAKRLEIKQIKINWNQLLVDEIARRSVKENLGARPVRRLIQDQVEAYLAKKMLEVDDARGMLVELDVGVLKS